MKTYSIFIFVIFFSVNIAAQPLNPQTVSIPMRDGKFLAADVYVPNNQYPRPTILIQTPYNKNFYRYGLPLDVGINLASSQYNFVIVDWRGFYGSASAMVSQPDRGKDGYDVIDWIVQQEWSNGKVGTWGPSALGKIQYQTAKEQHPAHKCAVPLVASPEFLYQTYYPNGAYRKEYVDQLDALGFGLSGIILANPYYNLTWYFAETTNFYPQQIKIPMLLIGGWYDHNIVEMVKYFNDLCNLSEPIVRNFHRFVIGPWAHGGFGIAHVGDAQQGELYFYEAQGFNNLKAKEFFAYYLLDAENNWPENNSKYTYFQMGDMQWLTTDIWPPAGLIEKRFYLHENGILSINVPQQALSYSYYYYDPADPSPTIGGATLRSDLLQGPYDQSQQVENRNDILVFSSEILTQPLIHKGKPVVKLFVSSDKLDTDFVVRLCDVYPDERSMLLNDNIFRMRFRNGFSVNDTTFMHNGEIYEITISLPDLAHTFLPGHRIRLDISSSNYPRFDNNLNNGGQLYTPGDTLIALNKVYHQSDKASYLILSVDEPTNNKSKSINYTDCDIFPNPACNYDIITIDSFNKIKTIIITNVSGATLKVIDAVNAYSYSYNLNNIESGVYILKIIDEANNSMYKKLIIQ